MKVGSRVVINNSERIEDNNVLAVPLEVECVLPMQQIVNSNSIPIHAENDSTKQLYSSLSHPRYIFFCFIYVCNPKIKLCLPFVLYRPGAQKT
jgi:hypothetical protein